MVMAWPGAMGSMIPNHILNITFGFIVFVDFSGGGLAPSDPSLSDPSGPPWGIKGAEFFRLKNRHSPTSCSGSKTPLGKRPGES